MISLEVISQLHHNITCLYFGLLDFTEQYTDVISDSLIKFQSNKKENKINPQLLNSQQNYKQFIFI